ncbi:hypothetical protein SPOG_05283 [Schizosaccharomyces cryophilus OY26]|uniref:Uncharacterized protein n=1 Tax=Schizosaccharomyces cryophilus (strain OY26 / ATCC MYA-4695 / CBS 11777 / NBRC 106824 / NRRL Y48691) TaxID=653667 RepID=S9X5T4_SCHCR|nr:uncharacterized protein SPOG_05283 [Schizosaccharomyces cryophilus OY26]EPY52437.1 hypothetical protein SPOG_05283 [Schizosaccharomyces cryophilus OY26]
MFSSHNCPSNKNCTFIRREEESMDSYVCLGRIYIQRSVTRRCYSDILLSKRYHINSYLKKKNKQRNNTRQGQTDS